MKKIIVLCVLAFSMFSVSIANAQQPEQAPLLRPFVVGELDLNGGGYQPFSESFGAGLDLESKHVLGEIEADYENARKTNDGTVNNKKGHERFLKGFAAAKFGNGFFAGGGLRWSETSTTNYTKQGWGPMFGGGKDLIGDRYSARLQAFYHGAGNDKINGVQGVEIGFYMPSPATKGHFFFRETVDIDVFHATVQPGATPAQIALYDSQHSAATYLTTGILIRF